MFWNFFLLMENLGAMADPRYTGFREITDSDVLALHCITDPCCLPTFSCKLFLEVNMKDKFQICSKIINDVFEEYIKSTKRFKIHV